MKTTAHLHEIASKLRSPRIEPLEARIAPASVLNFSGTGTVVVDLAAHTVTDSAAPGSPVSYTGFDVVDINSAAAVTIKGTPGPDDLTYTPSGASAGTVTADQLGLTINFAGVSGAFIIDPLGGGDHVTVKGSSADDLIVAHGGATPTVQVGALKPLTLVSANTAALVIEGLDGNDTLTVDSTAGAFAVPITFHGGNGFDTLKLQGGIATSSTYTLGPTPDAGINTMVVGGATQTVNYAGIEPIFDNVPSASITVNGTSANNAINYTQGPGGGIFTGNTGLISVDNNETIEFNNKTNLIINGLAGSDTINLHYNNTTNPAGLTGTITVNGGDPTDSDTLVVNGLSGVLDNLRYLPTAAGAGTVINDSEPQPNVLFTGIEHLSTVVEQADGDGVRLDGTTGNDAFEFTHGLTSDSGTFTGTMDQNNATGSGPFTMTPMNFSGASPVQNDVDVNFFNPGGTDSFVFNGTANDDTINVAGGEAGGTEFRDTLNGIVASRLEVFNITSGLVRGLAGNDTVNVFAPAGPAAVTLRVEGGGSSASSDVLNYFAPGNAATVIDLGASSITSTVPGGNPVTFSGFATINEISSGAGSTLMINGTAGADDFAYTPSGATAGTVTLGNGPVVTFSGVGSTFTIDPLGGNDHIAVNGSSGDDPIVALGGATPTVQVGALKTLTLVAANTEAFTINGLDGDDSLAVDNTAGAFTAPLTFHGGNGSNTVEFQGTATSSSYTLGPTSDAGASIMDVSGVTQTVSFNGVESIQDSVSATTLTVDGTDTSNSINYVQGPGGGIFTGKTGLISVDGYATVEFNNKTNLVIAGLAGDDTINLHYNNTTNPVGLTGTITVDGGDPTGSDTLVVNGLSGVLDNLRYLPTAVGAGTVINDTEPQPNVLFTGVEHLNVVVQQADADGVRVDGTTGNDAFEFSHGPTSDSGTFTGTMDQNNATGSGPFTMTPMKFSGISPGANDLDVNFFNPGGTDSLVFNGTAGNDTINVGSGEAGGTEFRDTLNGIIASRLEVFNIASGLVRGLAGDDTINLSVPAGPAAVALQIEGSGSDVLNYTASFGATTTVDLATSSITSSNGNPVTFSGIAVANINGHDGSTDHFVIQNYGAPNGLSALNLNGADAGNNDGDTISVTLTSSGPSTIDYTPQSTSAAEISRGEGGPTIHISGFNNTDGDLTLNKGAGFKPFFVNFNAAGTTNQITVSNLGGGTHVVDSVGGVSKWVPIDLGTATTLTALSILAGPGDDTLTVDNGNGAVSLSGGIFFDGGTGRNTLIVSGGDATSDEYIPGPGIGQGSDIQVIGGQTQKISFANLTPFFDANTGPLQVDGTTATNAINYAGGNDLSNTPNSDWGQVTIDAFEAINFTNKTTLTINTLAGSDTININNPNTPAGLTGITVTGGGQAWNDTLTLFGTAAADNFIFNGVDEASGTLTLVGSVPVDFTATKHAVLAGLGGDDNFNVASAAGRVELIGGSGSDTVDFTGAPSSVTFNLDAVGVDQQVNTSGLIVNLGDVAENFTGSAFNDVVFAGVQSFARTIDGGAPSAAPGDHLTVDGHGAPVFVKKVTFNSGTVTAPSFGTISFSDVESVSTINSTSNAGFGTPGNAFDAPVTNKVGKVPIQVITGDLNGDGFDDIVTVNPSSNTVSVLLSNGDGSFASAISYKTGGHTPQSVALANVDHTDGALGGDQDLDLIVANKGSKSVSVLLNDGNGGFGSMALFKTAASPGLVHVGDFNGDGLADIVALSKASATFSVLLNTGGGVAGTASFGAATFVHASKKGATATDFVVGNFDGDGGGHLDLAVVLPKTNSLAVLTGDGAGHFTQSPTTYNLGTHPTVLAIADFNNDGIPDIAVSHKVSQDVTVLLGRGNVGGDLFKPQITTTFAFGDVDALVAGDFNGDGNEDLAFAAASGSTMQIALGMGSGLFQPAIRFPIHTAPSAFGPVQITSIAAGDFNGDGATDVVVSNRITSAVTVQLRTPGI